MKTWRAWTKAEEIRLRRARTAGFTAAELAPIYGRTEKAIAVKLRRLKAHLSPQQRSDIARKRYWKAHAKTS